jgi:hypothetical protein
MSINSLANAAAARRTDLPPVGVTPRGVKEIAAAAARTPAGPAEPTPSANVVDTALHVIFGYIPTEVLTLYVAVLAVLHQPNAPPGKVEWRVFWGFLVATPIVVWVVYAGKIKAAQKPIPVAFQQWPVWEMFAATVAYFAWTLGLPETPFIQYSWYSSALAGLIVVLASTILALLAPLFQRPIKP